MSRTSDPEGDDYSEHEYAVVEDRPSVKNASGLWVPAIPLPYFLSFGRVECGHRRGTWVCRRRFWSEETYRGHFALVHVMELD